MSDDASPLNHASALSSGPVVENSVVDGWGCARETACVKLGFRIDSLHLKVQGSSAKRLDS